jgi:hypothetical protein
VDQHHERFGCWDLLAAAEEKKKKGTQWLNVRTSCS